jgi:hypothetical protein
MPVTWDRKKARSELSFGLVSTYHVKSTSCERGLRVGGKGEEARDEIERETRGRRGKSEKWVIAVDERARRFARSSAPARPCLMSPILDGRSQRALVTARMEVVGPLRPFATNDHAWPFIKDDCNLIVTTNIHCPENTLIINADNYKCHHALMILTTQRRENSQSWPC